MSDVNFVEEYKIDPSLCDEIVIFYNESDKKYVGTIINSEGQAEVRKEFKDSTDLVLDDNDLITKYYNALQETINEYINKYPSANMYATYETRPTIQHYEPGGGLKIWHHELDGKTYQTIHRHLVYMTYLNDVPDGGTEFLYQNLTTKAIKGNTVIWPATWTHTHRGQISQTHEKIIITGWIRLISDEEKNNVPMYYK